jgi:hypothetical protein
MTLGNRAAAAVMARWRVDFIGKVLRTLGSIEAPDEKSAIVEAAKQFNITPAPRNKIVVTRTQAAERRAPDSSAGSTER